MADQPSAVRGFFNRVGRTVQGLPAAAGTTLRNNFTPSGIRQQFDAGGLGSDSRVAMQTLSRFSNPGNAIASFLSGSLQGAWNNSGQPQGLQLNPYEAPPVGRGSIAVNDIPLGAFNVPYLPSQFTSPTNSQYTNYQDGVNVGPPSPSTGQRQVISTSVSPTTNTGIGSGGARDSFTGKTGTTNIGLAMDSMRMAAGMGGATKGALMKGAGIRHSGPGSLNDSRLHAAMNAARDSGDPQRAAWAASMREQIIANRQDRS